MTCWASKSLLESPGEGVSVHTSASARSCFAEVMSRRLPVGRGGVLSGTVRFCSGAQRLDRALVDDIPVTEDMVVGGPGFYLDRPGFWLGGIGVAGGVGGAGPDAADHRPRTDVPRSPLRPA